MKHYQIFYNDGVYAETITFVDKTNEFIEKYLTKRIFKYNQNINNKYHITRNNIKEV